MKCEAKTEQEMRDAEVPPMETMADLTEYIQSLVEREHDYGTCVYAMSLAAVAAFRYVSRQLGVTGFQASCADLDILSRTRHMRGRPFAIIDSDKMLYPQYDLVADTQELIEKWTPWAAEEAKKLLAEHASDPSTKVMEHWKVLAEAEVDTSN